MTHKIQFVENDVFSLMGLAKKMKEREEKAKLKIINPKDDKMKGDD